MPIFTPNPELRNQIFQNVRDQVLKPRDGIHLSDTCFCSRKAYFRKMDMAPSATDEQCLLWLTGFAFQAYMFPLELEEGLLVDGINCTPDVRTGIEVKTTRQSSKKFVPEEMAHWHRQILGYAKALGKLEYDLVVMFITGNYAPPFPSLDCWHIQATQEEVDQNWRVVLEKAEVLRGSILLGIPPLPDPWSWEGQYCECWELCPDTPCHNRRTLKKSL